MLISKPSKESGYTLTEVLVVLVLLGLVTALAPPAIARLIPSVRVDLDAQKLRSDIRAMRLQALKTGAALELSIVDDGHGYEIFKGETLWRERSVSSLLSDVINDNKDNEGLPLVTVSPSGTYESAEINLTYRGRVLSLQIDPVMQVIEVVKP